ncbi:hypothetical protein AKL17_1p0007 (plasmid) [Frigidibacter mobilis]|uniref:Uncharacterized protein n=1 Tax=Frigidibacter mobilis TaxID=1335048 RepID=A0A159ZAL1_9RHOB|nr:hypothetical protein AKL17_1p0007 [Frigidibacter mobilis]
MVLRSIAYPARRVGRVYPHGYGSTYERDLLLEVRCGAVVETSVRHNDVLASDGDDGLPF